MRKSIISKMEYLLPNCDDLAAGNYKLVVNRPQYDEQQIHFTIVPRDQELKKPNRARIKHHVRPRNPALD